MTVERSEPDANGTVAAAKIEDVQEPAAELLDEPK
jgi:enoyl reductase-like protein